MSYRVQQTSELRSLAASGLSTFDFQKKTLFNKKQKIAPIFCDNVEIFPNAEGSLYRIFDSYQNRDNFDFDFDDRKLSSGFA